MSLVTCGSVQSRNVWNYTRLMDCIQTCSLRLHTRTICDWCWRRRSWNEANGHQHWQRSMVWRSWLHIFWTFRKNCPFPHAQLTWTDLCMRPYHSQVPQLQVAFDYLSANVSIDIHNHFCTGSTAMEDVRQTKNVHLQQLAGVFGFCFTNGYLAYCHFRKSLMK